MLLQIRIQLPREYTHNHNRELWEYVAEPVLALKFSVVDGVEQDF